MNDFYNPFDSGIFETPEERQEKSKKQKKLFSRVFLALFIYFIVSRIAAFAIYGILHLTLSAAKYEALAYSTKWSVIISCAAQYLVGLPALLLSLIGIPKSARIEKKTLEWPEILIFFAIGEVLMYAGNLIGTFLNGIIGNITGSLPENNISNIVSEIPIWLIFVAMVVLAPIVEELMFRKLMIDRLSIYGDKTAIIFSSVAFGLMHGNLYQFFYAALLGALFGYVYTKTHKIHYTMIMHAIVNFMGSIVVLPVQEATLELNEIMAAAGRGELINLFALIVCGSILLIYSNLQSGLLIGGIIALVQYIKKKKISISPDKEVYISDEEIAKNGAINLGAILFFAATLITVFLNLF